MNSIARDRYA